MIVDMSTPQARMARHYMRDVKGVYVDPHTVEALEGIPCWYFYYDLPQGELELEVFWDEGKRDWDVAVTAFPVTD